MKRGTGKFKQIEETIHVCDECGKEINPFHCVVYDHKWSDGYDDYGDREEFCSMECLIKYVNEETEIDGNYFFPSSETVSLDVPSETMKIILDKFK